MSEYLRRLARRGAEAPAPEAIAPPRATPAFAFEDTRGTIDETDSNPGDDREASTPSPSPRGEHADGEPAGTLPYSAPPSRSAAPGSMAEVTETSPVRPPRRRPYEGVLATTSRPDAPGEPESGPEAGAAPVSTAATRRGRDQDAGRASDVAQGLSTLSAPSHAVGRARPAMPPALGRSEPDPSGRPAADIVAISAEIGNEVPHTTARDRGRESRLHGDAEAADSPRFATEPHLETEPRDAPTAPPKDPDPSGVLAPAPAAVVATPPAPAPVPQAPPVHRPGPEVSVSVGRITVQSEAPHPTPTEPTGSPRPSCFSSMTLARRHVDRRWY